MPLFSGLQTSTVAGYDKLLQDEGMAAQGAGSLLRVNRDAVPGLRDHWKSHGSIWALVHPETLSKCQGLSVRVTF